MFKETLARISSDLREPYSMEDAVRAKLDWACGMYAEEKDAHVGYLLHRKTERVIRNIERDIRRSERNGD